MFSLLLEMHAELYMTCWRNGSNKSQDVPAFFHVVAAGMHVLVGLA